MYSLYTAVLLVVAASASAGVIGGIGESSAVVAGPSGTIVRDGHASHGLVASPVLTQGIASHGIIGHGAIGHGALNYGSVGQGVVGHAALGYGAIGHGVGHGALGYGGAIAHTPLGYPVPAGSGLEGQYVHDLSEKLLYDDGTYKPHVYGL